jgi:hypothetical protein
VPATRQPPASPFSDNRAVSAQRGCTVNKPQDTWELYYLPEDFSRARNIGADHPDTLAELKELFWQEAQKYQVLSCWPASRRSSRSCRRCPPSPKRTLYGDVQNVLSDMIPRVYGHSWAITAELQIPPQGAEGVVVGNVGAMNSFSMLVQAGKLRHTYSQ